MCEDANSKLVEVVTVADVDAVDHVGNSLLQTRSYAALWAADLEWIVRPGYSLSGHILEKNHEKPTWIHEKP